MGRGVYEVRSSQRRYFRLKKEGKCVVCGGKARENLIMCQSCADKNNRKDKEKYGKTWKRQAI